jgi:hypothetical protein
MLHDEMVQTHLPRPNTLDDNREPASDLLDPSDVGPLERRVVASAESEVGSTASHGAVETCTHSERRECLSDRVMGLSAGACAGRVSVRIFLRMDAKPLTGFRLTDPERMRTFFMS